MFFLILYRINHLPYMFDSSIYILIVFKRGIGMFSYLVCYIFGFENYLKKNLINIVYIMLKAKKNHKLVYESGFSCTMHNTLILITLNFLFIFYHGLKLVFIIC